MKKRIFMLLVAVVMMLGMSQSVLADEIKYYEGTLEWRPDDYSNDTQNVTAKATLDGETFVIEFVDNTGQHIRLTGGRAESHDWAMVIDTDTLWFDDVSVYANGAAYFYPNNRLSVGCKGMRVVDGIEIYYSLNGTLNLSEKPTDPLLHEIITPFAGTAESHNGSYILAIAGHYIAELEDGTHTLSASDITAQTIAVVAYNKANGVMRVMRENTVEGMSVTVLGGQVTEYVIHGRVQTDGGSLDRYTAIINP